MRFRVRPAIASDIGAIFDLAVEMVLTSRSALRPEVEDQAILQARRNNLGDLASILDLPEGGMFVAVDEKDQPIGHVILLGNNVDSVSDSQQAWVYDVSVRKDWWGHGVGRELMAAAEAFAASLGLQWIGLGVTVANERALGFYKELGYGIERYQLVKRLERGPS